MLARTRWIRTNWIFRNTVMCVIKSNRSHVVWNLRNKHFTVNVRHRLRRCLSSRHFVTHVYHGRSRQEEMEEDVKTETDQLALAFACNFISQQNARFNGIGFGTSITRPIGSLQPLQRLRCTNGEQKQISNNSTRVSLQHNNTSRIAHRILSARWLHAILTRSIRLAATIAAVAMHFQREHNCLAKRNASRSPSNAIIIIIKFSIMNQFGSTLLRWKKYCVVRTTPPSSPPPPPRAHIWIGYRCDSVDALRRRRRRRRRKRAAIKL